MRAIRAVVTGRRDGAITVEMETGTVGRFITNKRFKLYSRVSVLFDPGKMEITDVLSEYECLDLDKVPDVAGGDFSDNDASDENENIEVIVIPEDLSGPGW